MSAIHVTLPTEVLWEILSQVPGRDVLRICQTGTTLAQVCQDQHLWFRKLVRDFGIVRNLPEELSGYEDDPKRLYVSLLRNNIKIVDVHIDGKFVGTLAIQRDVTVDVTVSTLTDKFYESLPLKVDKMNYFISFITPDKQYVLRHKSEGRDEALASDIETLDKYYDTLLGEFYQGVVWAGVERINFTSRVPSKTRFIYTPLREDEETLELALDLGITLADFQNIIKVHDDDAWSVDLTFSFWSTPLHVSLDDTVYSVGVLYQTLYDFFDREEYKGKLPRDYFYYTLRGTGSWEV